MEDLNSTINIFNETPNGTPNGTFNEIFNETSNETTKDKPNNIFIKNVNTILTSNDNNIDSNQIINQTEKNSENINHTENIFTENSIKKNNTKKNSTKKNSSKKKKTYVLDSNELKDLDFELKPKQDIFIRNSKINNDNIIKKYLLHYKYKEYKCEVEKCKVTEKWLGQTTFLYLVKKNSINNDLRLDNLLFMCPNCYVQKYGEKLFLKSVNDDIKKCKSCNKKIEKIYDYCFNCKTKINDYSLLGNDNYETRNMAKFLFDDNYSMNDFKFSNQDNCNNDNYNDNYNLNNSKDNNEQKFNNYKKNNIKKTNNSGNKLRKNNIKKVPTKEEIESLPEELQFIINTEFDEKLKNKLFIPEDDE
tara:strand:- start:2655 stop:3737 length:1083 start_codon:yes stop_codon:yes gene_type:complete